MAALVCRVVTSGTVMFVVDGQASGCPGGPLAYGASAALAGVQKLIVLRGELIGVFDFSGVSEALRAFPPGTPVRGTASGPGATVWGWPLGRHTVFEAIDTLDGVHWFSASQRLRLPSRSPR